MNTVAIPQSQRKFRWILLAGFVVLALIHAWHYRAGTDTHVPIHDNLDGNLPRYVMMATLPVFAPMDATLPQAMGGLPKNSLHSDLGVYPLLVRTLPPFSAYVIHGLFVRIMAFAGMLLLARDHLRLRNRPLIATGLSLAFALLPFWPGDSLNAAGQPLLAWAVLNVMTHRAGVGSWLTIGLFPFASSLAFVGWGIAAALFILIVAETIRTRRLHGPLVAALVLIVASYSVVEYRALVQMLFDEAYVSHRSEFGMAYFSRFTFGSMGEIARAWLSHVVRGHDYVNALPSPVIVVSVALAAAALAVSQILHAHPETTDSGNTDRLEPDTPLSSRTVCMAGAGLIVIILLCSGAEILAHTTAFKRWTLEQGGVLGTLNLRRLNRFLPLAWYALFALAVGWLDQRLRYGRAVVAMLVALQLVRVVVSLEVTQPSLERRGAREITFSQYYAEPLFDEIEAHIGRPQSDYRVVSVGAIAGIAQFNGFHTADGYFPNYPLQYKHRFRRLIEPELQKSSMLNEIFSDWASQCYVRPADSPWLGYDLTRIPEDSSTGLELNPRALNDLGIDYVFSLLPIQQPERSSLVFERTFTREDTMYTVHLYRVAGE